MTKLSEKTVVQIVHLDDTGDSCYRMKWPAMELAKKVPSSKILNVVSTSKERYQLAEFADLLILFNPSDIDFLTIINRRKKLGLKTLIEFNDNFYDPQPWSPIAKEWSSVSIHNTYELFLKAADGIIVTGDGLKELFESKVDCKIHIIKNNLLSLSSTLSDLIKNKTECTIGWAGSLGHIADILSITSVIQDILKTDTNTSFHVMGNESLNTILNMPKQQFEYTTWGDMDSYFAFWNPISIGVIPLLDTPYNNCRSDIKVIEMVSMGVLPIVPNLTPYKKIIQEFNLLSYTNHETLKESLIKGISLNKDQRIDLLFSIHSYISSKRIESNNFDRLNIYESYLTEYFPTKSSYLFSKYSVGYQVVIGTQNSSEMYSEILKSAQKDINDGKLSSASETLKKLIQESPNHPEYTLALASILRKQDIIKAKEFIVESINRFPQEIRFRLLFGSICSKSDRNSFWEELLIFLPLQTEIYKKGVRDQIISLLITHINEDFKLAEVGEKMLLIYPQQYKLRFSLAVKYEQNFYIKEARAHFKAVLQAKKQLEEGLKDLIQFEEGYISAWYEALDKRMKGSLK